MEDLKSIKDKSVAIMVTQGFEEIELTAPYSELLEYGAKVHIISDKAKIKSWQQGNWGSDFTSDRLLESTRVNEYDMLLLPGGVINADKLRRNKKAIEIIKIFNMQGKLIAAICHGPQLLIEAGLITDKTITAHGALRTDIINAGAIYNEASVVQCENLVTAQGAKDVSAFLKKILTILKLEEPKEVLQ